jgi:Adenylate and Guanylate cyclase catalytic domain
MNTASRMESTGTKDKIQISQDTANLLKAAGKESWISPRDEKVLAKGKGELQTYWLVSTLVCAAAHPNRVSRTVLNVARFVYRTFQNENSHQSLQKAKMTQPETQQLLRTGSDQHQKYWTTLKRWLITVLLTLR